MEAVVAGEPRVRRSLPRPPVDEGGARHTSTPSTRRGFEIAVVLGLLALSIAAHATNMFGFPYYENDEGTYVSRAWQFITQGELDIYTYRYDHAPAGWMVLGAWLGITGGTAIFGSLLESGRVFMLVLHTASTLMLYVIARRMSGGMTAGIIAVLVFAVSPLGVYFQRRILLDNIMMFWVLLAILLLLRFKLTLSAVVTSGIVFGLAVLTKFSAAFFGLGFLVLIWMLAAPHQRRHAITMWLAFAGGTVLLYILYALLNNELFSAPLTAAGEPRHVSLLDTLGLQMGRGDPGLPWEVTSNFFGALTMWVLRDWFTIALGATVIIGLVVLVAVRRRTDLFPLAVLLMIVGYLGFLVRGGLVLDLYVTPLVPLIGLAGGLITVALVGWIRWRPVRAVLGAAVTLSIGATYVMTTSLAYSSVDETSNQASAVDWITDNVPADAILAADNYVYPALAQEGDFDRALYFFSAEYDPESREVFDDDWRELDYLVVTHEFVQQVSQGMIPDLHDALDHAELVTSFTEGTTSFLDLSQDISTNGDWAQVYRVKSRNQIVLQDTWEHFLEVSVHDYGRVAASSTGSITTSADQATGMAQALSQGDEAWFRGIWQWTNDHLRHRENDGLISRDWQTDADGDGSLLTSDTDCRSDLQTAALLVTAGSAWEGAEDLALQGRQLADDWWTGCVFERNGALLVDSTADGSIDDALLNPSVHDPGLYASLAAELPERDWTRLEDDGYAFLDRLIAERGTVPNWVVLTTDGELASAAGLIGVVADGVGGEVLRLVPALIEAELAGDPRATRILDTLQPQLVEYWELNRSLPASTTVALLAQVRSTGFDAEKLYTAHIATEYDSETGAWGDEPSLSDHYWGWSWHSVQAELPATLSIPLE